MNSIIGQVLLWGGFLSGALATVFSTGTYARLGVNVSQKKDSKVVLVDHVSEETPAWKAGLRKGDQLISVDGNEITSADGFGKLVGGIDSEAAVKFVYDRDGTQTTSEVTALNAWKTVDWTWYLVSAAICFVGVCFLRIGKRITASADEHSGTNVKQIKANLADAIKNTEDLDKAISKLSPRQILNFIEEKLLDDLRDFADGRDSITAEHGLEVFANVMTQFAAGERAINRAWSASADGYVQEAETCVQHGLTMLKSAQDLLNAAAKEPAAD